jgi:hypothetical protein
MCPIETNRTPSGQSTHRFLSRAASLIAVVLTAAPAPVSAQSAQVQQRAVGRVVTEAEFLELQRRVTALESLRDLEARVRELELSKGQAVVLDKDPQDSAQLPWQKLRLGMSQEEVFSLLGEPNRVVAGMLINWFYSSQGYLGPYVSFENGRVVEWSAPD